MGQQPQSTRPIGSEMKESGIVPWLRERTSEQTNLVSSLSFNKTRAALPKASTSMRFFSFGLKVDPGFLCLKRDYLAHISKSMHSVKRKSTLRAQPSATCQEVKESLINSYCVSGNFAGVKFNF